MPPSDHLPARRRAGHATTQHRGLDQFPVGSSNTYTITRNTLIGAAAGETSTAILSSRRVTNSTARLHTFADGLVIATNGRVEGAATIAGNVSNAGEMELGVGAGTLKIVGALSFSGNGFTDINNDRMIVTGSPVGGWTGSTHTGLTGQIASGRMALSRVSRLRCVSSRSRRNFSDWEFE